MKAVSFTSLGLLALVVFRLWFSVVLPMTGDEAYFVSWGEHPAGGYYDHPPMVGWWLSGLLAISRDEWFLRLPALVLPLILAGGAWWLVYPYGAARARLAALLVVLQPVNVWNVLITTDTPVILFSMLSVLAYVAALRSGLHARRALFWHAAAGALLGLAFLGKYFAALLGLAYLAHVLFIRRDRSRSAGFAFLMLAALPAPAYNLWWNSAHCWVNILFNFMNRNEGAGFSWHNPLLYIASLAYLATPWLLFELWRQRRWVITVRGSEPGAGAIFWLMLVPLLIFALMSFARPVGLHWLVSFIPLLAVLAAMALPLAALVRLVRWSAVFATVQVLAIIVVAALPIQSWRNSRLYDGIVLTVCADELLALLQPYAADYSFAMDGYSPAATLAYKAQRPFAVFGEGSFHARQDDFMTDWRTQDGRKVLILRKSAPDSYDYAAFFEHVDFREIELHGARYYLVLGQGFKYSVYHDKVLARIRERFYWIPAWLPQRGCEFCERYFPEGT
ncbi:glycosyltransferase family 39 protein [Propionivibrio sp.]|uniref:glycosyltransferase family 39 protein n=1 Tax=Propionivibrio sp. TaxID=2212460 RepID=UPI0026208A3A|nr:glycosyltransferase family 39 protein [Propionivibrio sp.]